MTEELRSYFDHSRHRLSVRGVDAPLDVLSFEGREGLSQPYNYTIEFTSVDRDIAVEGMLGQEASFSLHARPNNLPTLGLSVPAIEPLRTLHGVVTRFKRLSDSVDLARYEVTLEPRLALLDRGRQYRIYQYQSVPQIVESVLRSRHDFRGQDFFFNLLREYPSREQVMQYDESDLAFISRLLAEVGIWYRITHDERLKIDVVEFHDGQRYYQYDVELEYVPQSGLSSSGQDAVWALQTSHQVVEKHVNLRTYQHRLAREYLDTELDLTRGATTTYGEAYHYADAYTELGNRYAYFEDIQCESGQFYARLHHERYLNEQTRLSGISSSATLAPGQVLKISGGAPQAFAPGTVITHMTTRAARDRGLEVSFQGTPFSEFLCFRPPLLPKPQIAGTVPARVTSSKKHDPYGHIDIEGRYKVNFLFDRDTWDQGKESLWLRLARPYAGDTHGLHLPLLDGTEVAVAFEQGDPDRPYIAHALHDSQHPDHVTLRNYKRNVLRTPTNNKLRMDDTRGQEHVKLSTEHSGKSQLNLGHMVNEERRKRGEGFELRTDGHGAIRAGKGLFISADEQAKARGNQLDMEPAIEQLTSALSLARSLAQAIQNAEMEPGDIESQEDLLVRLKALIEPGLLLHAPGGIGVVSPKAVSVASGAESVGITAAHNTDIGAGRNITAAAEHGVSLLAQTQDLQMKAVRGDVKLHAYGGDIHALAKNDIKIESVDGVLTLTAFKELVLHCDGACLRLKDGKITLTAPNGVEVLAPFLQKFGTARGATPATSLPEGYAGGFTVLDDAQNPLPFARYQIITEHGAKFSGVTDKSGHTMTVHTATPGDLNIETPDAIAAYDEQLHLVGPDQEVVANLKYEVALADGSTVEGVTDSQGFTKRIVTREPTQLTQITLMPPEEVEPFCCAAQNAQAPLVIDLSSRDISTNNVGIEESFQSIQLPKGKKRALTSGEIAMARTIFKDSVDYAKVKVHHGGWWLFMGAQNTAVTPNGEMYYPASTELYRDDFSSGPDPVDKALFIHEMAHVWQYQLGYPVKKAGLLVTSRGAQAYKYEVTATSTFSDYNMEQQGEIASDYYMICVLGQPDYVWNSANRNKNPDFLRSTVSGLLERPSDKSNLPG